MKLFGNSYTKSDLQHKTGRIQQLFGTRHYSLSQGSANGTRCVDVHLGEFSFTVVPDRCMDISRASYRGCNLVYQSPVGEVHPAYYDSDGEGFAATFFAGLLTTCGLTNLSGGGVDPENGEKMGVHGRIHAMPAYEFADLSRWEGEEYIVELRGSMQEAHIFRHKLRMTRTIRAVAGQNRLTITDEVENFGVAPSPLTILYHINPGFPLLDTGAKIASTQATVTGNDYSQQFIDSVYDIGALEAGYKEQNYLFVMETAEAEASISNPKLMSGIGAPEAKGLYVKWRTDQMPYMNLWKCLDGVDYVIGLEPCNAPCRPRTKLREQGLLPIIQPGERKEFTVEIGVR